MKKTINTRQQRTPKDLFCEFVGYVIRNSEIPNAENTCEEKKHNHYFVDVSNYEEIDIYRITELYGCSHMAAHITKKALCTGKRGHKDLKKDIQEIIDTAHRWLEMINEDQQ